MRITAKMAAQHGAAANKLTHIAKRMRSNRNTKTTRQIDDINNQNWYTHNAYLGTRWATDEKLKGVIEDDKLCHIKSTTEQLSLIHI